MLVAVATCQSLGGRHMASRVCRGRQPSSLSWLRPLGCTACEPEVLLFETWGWLSVCAEKGERKHLKDLQINPSASDLAASSPEGPPPPRASRHERKIASLEGPC